MSNYGFVYILGNESMPDIFKIGCSERSPHARADELSKPTGVPTPFQVLCYIEVEDFQAVERNMHKWFDEYRVNPSREFFHGCLRWAVQCLFFHPTRLSFTDCTSGRSHIQSSELICRVTNDDEFYFNDMPNPYAKVAVKVEKAEEPPVEAANDEAGKEAA